MDINIVKVDFTNEAQVSDLTDQLIAYSGEPMGGGKALEKATASKNIQAFGNKNNTAGFVAYSGSTPAGFCTCIESFSTFAGKPCINIHDLAVGKQFRGQGISRKLIAAAEDYARSIDACKITLEVLEGNTLARKAYTNIGFAPYTLDDLHGCAQFWQKPLNKSSS